MITEISDKKAVEEIQKIIANSTNVKNRIKKIYDRESIIIYPPIETKKMFCGENKNYWLSVNRITPEKRVEIQVKAFQKLPEEKLLIVGGYDNYHSEYKKKVININQKNVFFTGNINNDELIELYSNCKGFITTSLDEDFGMTVVEAMVSGKPVIAPNEGGYKETIINGKTGILIDSIDEEKLIEAINIINNKIKNNPLEYKDICQKHAENFSTEAFIRKMKEEIQNSNQ